MDDTVKKMIDEMFPGSLSTAGLIDFADKLIETSGFQQEKVKPAIALCRDDSTAELNKMILERGYSFFFSMETLSGIPACGKTAVTAWYHHIPDEGIGLIIYSPHIGVSEDGRWGFLNRQGMAEPGKSCGANHSLIGLWKRGNEGPYNEDPELSEVSNIMSQKKDEIMASDYPLMQLTEEEYDIGLDMLTRYIKDVQANEEHKFPVVLISGMHIDTPHESENRFQVRSARYFENNNYKEMEIPK